MLENSVLFNFLSPIIDEFPLEMVGLFYLGPDTILPLTSICAGLIGFVLIFWRFFLGLWRRFYQRINPSAATKSEVKEEAHDQVNDE